MARYSHTRRLLDVLFEGGLENFVRRRRDQARSWRGISVEIYDRHQVEITPQTLAGWFPEDEAKAG